MAASKQEMGTLSKRANPLQFMGCMLLLISLAAPIALLRKPGNLLEERNENQCEKCV